MNLLWHLNFDGEFELAAADGDYHRSPKMTAHCARLAGALGPDILSWSGEGAAILTGPAPEPHPPATRLIPWIPTAGTRALATARQVAMVPHPALEVVARANHRSLAAWVSTGLPTTFVDRMDQLDDAVREFRALGHGVILKRALGFGGRWQKVIGSTVVGTDRRWAEASLTDYGRGLQVEPRVDVLREWVTHGHLDATGQLRSGPLTRLRTDDAGRWRGNQLETGQPDPADPGLVDRIRAAHQAAAGALADLGYFGPFGIDHFEYRDPDGAVHLRCNSDINARFTMGWFLAMAAFRPEDLLGSEERSEG